MRVEGGVVIREGAFLKLRSKWCMLIWGRGALIRTWALIQGNTVILTVQIFFEAELT